MMEHEGSALTFERRIASLEAKESVREQLHRYCRAMDRRDHALGHSVWHADGTADYGSIFVGTGRDFVDWVCESHMRLVTHSHQVTSIGIEVHDDTAVSEAYVTATLRSKDTDGMRDVIVLGRYLDRWRRRNGRWAIDHRMYIHDLDRVIRADAERMDGWGRRDRDDLSYDVLERL